MTCLTVALLLAMATAPPRVKAQWSRLPPLPDPEGFAGSFAGVSGEALLVAGGANFPGKKPWEGGKKVWYDTVFALDKPDVTWRVAGRLPRALGYGVSATHRGGVVCVGGSDADRHYADCFRLVWGGGRLTVEPLPSLPRPVANTCVVLVGDMLYIVGGQEKPDSASALKTVYAIDLAAAMPRWREQAPLPGDGRILAIAAACDGVLYIAGGASLAPGSDGTAKRTYLSDVYHLRPDNGWGRAADLPRPVVAAPSPAPSDARGFYVLGGDDGTKVGLDPPDRHPGFNHSVLRYDVARNSWSEDGTWAIPQVVTTAVRWADGWTVPSGEVRPGVRSPTVWTFTPETGR